MERGWVIGRAVWNAAVAIVVLGWAAFVVELIIGAAELAATGAIIASLTAGAMGVWFCGVFMADASRERAGG